MCDDISPCHFIAFVDKCVEFVAGQPHLHAYFMQDVCDEDAALLGGKGNAYEKKDNSISECAEFIPDELSEYGVEQRFMPVMKPLAYPLVDSGFADLGKTQAFLGGNALEFGINGRFNPPEGEPAGLLPDSGVGL